MGQLQWSNTAEDVVRESGVSLSGKTAIVTGGNAGIGKETVRALAVAGARVVFTSRCFQAGQAVAAELQAVTHNDNIIAKQLDLTDLASIHAFARDITGNEDRIDILICNAGIMFCSKTYTSAGFELQIGTNHFGHFALVQQLLTKLQCQAFPSRVVVVASRAHLYGSVNVQDLHFRKRWYNRASAYGQSKLANILFARELARRSSDNVSAFSLHPGTVVTDIMRHVFTPRTFFDRCGRVIASWFLKSPAQGAATSVYAALWPGLEQQSGGYLSDCAFVESTAAGQDMDLAACLWDETARQLAEADLE